MNQQEAQQLAQQVCDFVAAAGLITATLVQSLLLLLYAFSKLVAAFRAPAKLRKRGARKQSSLLWLLSPVAAGLLLVVASGYIGKYVALAVYHTIRWLPFLIVAAIFVLALALALIRWRRATRRAAAGVP